MKKTLKIPRITHWNYRLIKVGNFLQVHEVYYNGKKAHSWTEDPIVIGGESVDEILEDIDNITLACLKPILEIKNNKLYEIKNPKKNK